MTGKPSQQQYVDGTLEIGLIQGMVRLDMFRFSPTATNDKGEPAPEFVERLVLHPQAFLQTFAMMSDMMERMEKAGLISRKANGTAEQDRKAAEIPAVKDPTSPNFG